MHRIAKYVSCAVLVTCAISETPAQEGNTIGLLQRDARCSPGYTLFAPLSYAVVYLVDIDGNLCHSWKTVEPSTTVYLLENGHLLRMAASATGALGNRAIEELDWDGASVWRYEDSSGAYAVHHDLKRLPNGNTLVIAYETKSRAEVLAAGRDSAAIVTADFKSDAILELRPRGKSGADVVWKWSFWDHLSCDRSGHWYSSGAAVPRDVTDPARLDVNMLPFANVDWLHCNGVDYNASLDRIAISSLYASEFYVIDHSSADSAQPETGIARARSARGDVLYRWGNPQQYGRGNERDQRLYWLHDIQWIANGLPGAGHFLLFNNGHNRPGGNYSTIEEIVPVTGGSETYIIPVQHAFAPDHPLWTYTATPPDSLYSAIISGVQRLPNGNTLVCEGTRGRFLEVTAEGDVVWMYRNPVTSNGPQVQGSTISDNAVFKIRRYPPAFPAFAGRDLHPQGPVERRIASTAAPERAMATDLYVFPSPLRADGFVRVTVPPGERYTVLLHDVRGREQGRLADNAIAATGGIVLPLSGKAFHPGVYLCSLISGNSMRTVRIVIAP